MANGSMSAQPLLYCPPVPPVACWRTLRVLGPMPSLVTPISVPAYGTMSLTMSMMKTPTGLVISKICPSGDIKRIGFT